ncbi:MAG: hypothetical protein O2931_16430, partial [Planctomycetota bacterium]|nr:hypothetical protein [Planctomycetota bacterium]
LDIANCGSLMFNRQPKAYVSTETTLGLRLTVKHTRRRRTRALRRRLRFETTLADMNSALASIKKHSREQ